MKLRRSTLVGLAALIATSTLLTGCMSKTPATSESPSASSTVGAPTATNSATPTPTVQAVKIPGDCKSIMSAATYAATFASIPLNDPTLIANARTDGVFATQKGGSGVELAGAVKLHCLWRNPQADITYLEATILVVDPAVATTFQAGLQTNGGYTCAAANGGQQCQLVQQDPQYPVSDASTNLLRDTVFVQVSQANVSTNNLMGEIAGSIWG